MKLIKTAAAAAISLALLTGCNSEAPVVEPVPEDTVVRISAYNLSFDRSTFGQLVDEMTLTKAEQDVLIAGWFDDSLSLEDKGVAEKVIQIRNVAAVIQTERPAVILMNEFNNDGIAEDTTALLGFQKNYLAVAQKAEGASSTEERMLEPIEFPYSDNYQTNTGLMSGHDLNRDGNIDGGPDDAWGFGFYHGQYAFALLSMYPIDEDNVRTFQTFKWKDMPGETNPVVTNCDDPDAIPGGLACGDEWYTAEAWAEKPMSSKNHVDAPIIIPTENGDKVVHLLMSHPTPPVFDTWTENNKMLNRAEVDFWLDYVAGNGSGDYIYDDKGLTGGLSEDASFVVMGDLNADPISGDGDLTAINDLLNSEHVNVDATNGVYAPISYGGPECITLGECKEENWDTTYPDRITGDGGLRMDYTIPSSDLTITDSGVFWPATFEEGRMLMNDLNVGEEGGGKDISSDHRLVWIDVAL
ncbi:endonuclease/exonuclease/phosphatase family protein [Psychromonas ossibalaenae]|uniref:endonuclease/exonuclease/phosphatase family protein n=1 Tax=Psychromonas ossibalaenae TaxID=444922 RepID=UPI0003663E7A|nr:endonuclease/exonuclease/phosphatase family protein [Psychromonas ossibalaenae]